jgi:hypothetical protein
MPISGSRAQTKTSGCIIAPEQKAASTAIEVSSLQVLFIFDLHFLNMREVYHAPPHPLFIKFLEKIFCGFVGKPWKDLE